MGAAVATFAVAAFIYGMFRPDGALPRGVGRPTRLKVAALYGGLFFFGTAGGGGENDAPPPDDGAVVQVAGAAVSEEAQDPWPGGEAARDSTFGALASLTRSGRYVEAQDHARALAAQPYAASWADSLHRVARWAEEEARYESARRLPSSDLEGNRAAYASLVSAYPASPRAAVYAQKRDDYAQRIVDRDNARLRVQQRARTRSSGCCKRCSAGKPCGNSCISRSYTCRQPPGCAC